VEEPNEQGREPAVRTWLLRVIKWLIAIVAVPALLAGAAVGGSALSPLIFRGVRRLIEAVVRILVFLKDFIDILADLIAEVGLPKFFFVYSPLSALVVLVALLLCYSAWRWFLGGALRSAWSLFRRAARGIWEDLYPIISSPEGGESLSEKLDEFWRGNFYRLIFVFFSLGTSLLCLALVVAAVFPGREILRGAYYLLIFVGGGIAAAAATWRGRQFERQLRDARSEKAESRFEKALEMLTEKENKRRQEAGIEMLYSQQISPSQKKILRQIARQALSIKEDWRERYEEILEGMHVHKDFDLIKDVRQFVSKLARRDSWGDSDSWRFFEFWGRFSPHDESRSPNPGKVKIALPESLPLQGAWMVFPHFEINKVAYVGEISRYTRLNQVSCLYYQNRITNSIMRRVFFRTPCSSV